MNDSIRISSHTSVSMNEPLLHLVIHNGDLKVLERAIFANNSDQVVELFNDAAQVTGANATEMEQALADHVFRARSEFERATAIGTEGGYQAKFLTSAGLEALDVRHRWLVKNLLVRDLPALLGGPKKSMKTSIMIDLAISLGTGRDFLDKFEVPKRVKVAVLSGESGQATIKETALRVCQAKRIQLAVCDVCWGFELPRLGVDADLQALSAALRDNKIEVVFIDPAYLCLLAGVGDVNANNMFEVGPLLSRVARICAETDTTLVLVHHTTKAAGMQKTQTGDPLELEDLAYAGFQEFVRQWMLINRRQKYEPGSGKHILWMNIGGSAGHSGCWGVDVDEGKLDENFGGRRWIVKVKSMEDAMQSISDAKERAKTDKKKAKLTDLKVKLREVLLTLPDGETVTALAALIGESRTTGVTEALGEMRADGQVVLGEIEKKAGRRTQTHPAWRLARDIDLLRAQAARKGLVLPGLQEEDDDAIPDETDQTSNPAEFSVGADSALAGQQAV